MPLDTHPEEIETLVDVGDPRLLLGQAKAHRRENRRSFRAQALGVGSVPGHHQHPVVGITDEAVVGESLAASSLPSPRRAHRLLPDTDEVLVEDREGDVGKQRREDSPNAIGNFEFEVALPYRRGEKLFAKPRRRSTTQRDT
jgi:hypothetical protein